jgi:signal recognition particle subunit SRP54
MFEALGQRFGKIFSGLSGKVTESELENFISEIRLALLDSDVALEVAEEF